MGENQRRALSSGTLVNLQADDGNLYIIKIEEVIGFGGSCIAYRGSILNRFGENSQERSVIVKELYPSGLKLERNEENALLLLPEDRLTFLEREKLFSKGQTEHSRYYEMATGTALPRAFIYGRANYTCYAVSDPGAGYTLSRINRSTLSLYRIASIMESLCRAISPIHMAGLLYMDCKPDNIFLYRESEEDLQDHVYLFDFDTLIHEDYASHKDEYRVRSYSLGWCAPEQSSSKRRAVEQISYSTDIFSIGLVFYWLLTGKEPDSDEDKRRELLKKIQAGEIDWREESSFCKEASPEAVQTVQGILQKLLLENADERKNNFKNPDSVQSLIPEFQKLYSLTVGNNVHHASIYESVQSTQEKLMEEGHRMEARISSSEESIRREIKNASMKEFLFGTKKRLILSLLGFLFVLVLFGIVFPMGRTILQKGGIVGSLHEPERFESHLLLNLENANHQYEVGLENWKRLEYRRAERDLKAARDELSKQLGQNETEVAKMNNSLGCLYLDMGRYSEAYDYLNSAYVSFRDHFGEQSIEARATRESIASYYYKIGMPDEALKEIQDILDNSDKEKEKTLIAGTWHLKALIYDAAGDYEEALSLYKEVLNLYSDIAKDGKVNEAVGDYANNASLKQSEKDYYTNAIRWIISTYSSMAKVNLHKGNPEEAIKAENLGLDLSLSNIYIGKRNLTSSELYMHLAVSEGERSEIKTAIDHADLAMRIQRNLFDFTDVFPGLVEVYDVYGNLLVLDGKYPEAKSYFENAISLSEKSFGENHPITAAAYHELGKYEMLFENTEEALSCFKQSVEIRKNILAENHPETAVMLYDLALAEEKAEHTEEAKEAIFKAEKICDSWNMQGEWREKIQALLKSITEK